jgi:mRNA-degrading endonuclease toxin of MazEF toxin-antitoxin module
VNLSGTVGYSEHLKHLLDLNLDSVGTIRRRLLGPRITTLGRAHMAEVERALHVVLWLHLPCRAP